MEEFDVVVVGGGPAGASAARAAAKAGASVLVLEEHHEAGRPVQCAGLVTPRVFEHNSSRRSVMNEVKGAVFHSPSDHTFTVMAPEVKALVVDRAVFDREVLEDAVRAGAEVRLGAKMTGLEPDGKTGKVVGLTDGGAEEEVRCRVLVGADGPQSMVARLSGLPGPPETLTGAWAEVSCGELEPNTVHIFAGRDVAPGFFGWLIPSGRPERGSTFARAGLCQVQGGDPPLERLGSLLGSGPFRKVAGRVQVLAEGGGTIPLGPSKRTYADGVMVVGDAAAMAKPTSGGGLFTALAAGEICGDTAASAVKAGDTRSRVMSAYQDRWMDLFGRELKKGMTLRKAFMNLDDGKIEKAFDVLDDPEVLSVIVRKGDIDYPVSMSKAVLRKAPKLLTFAGPVIKALIF